MFSSPAWLALFGHFDRFAYHGWGAAHSCFLVIALACWTALLAFGAVVSPRVYETYSSLSRDDRREWLSRFVSTGHAIFQTIGALMILATIDSFDFNSWNGLAELFIVALVAYMLLDASICIVTPQLRRRSYFFHHLIAIGAGLFVTAYRCGCAPFTLFLLTEASTPFVNFHWFFLKSGMKDTPLFKWNGIVMWLVFGLVRVGLCIPIICARLWLDRHQVYARGGLFLWLGYAALFVGICAVNLVWFGRMTRGALKVLRGVDTSKTDKQD